MSSTEVWKHRLPYCSASSAKYAPWGGCLVTIQHDVEDSAGGPSYRQRCAGIHPVLHSVQAALTVHLELFLGRREGKNMNSRFMVPTVHPSPLKEKSPKLPSCPRLHPSVRKTQTFLWDYIPPRKGGWHL